MTAKAKPDPNVAPAPLCPHCNEPVDTGTAYGHYMNETTATKAGRTICPKAMQYVAYSDTWGWACPADHTCHLCYTPPPSRGRDAA